MNIILENWKTYLVKIRFIRDNEGVKKEDDLQMNELHIANTTFDNLYDHFKSQYFATDERFLLNKLNMSTD